MTTISSFFKKSIDSIEKEFGLFTKTLQRILPNAIAFGKALLEFVSSPFVENVLESMLGESLVTVGENVVKEAILLLTNAEIIVDQPNIQSMLDALANYLKKQSVSAQHMWINKLVSLIAQILDDKKLPEHIYDSLVQNAYTASKLAA
jgi:hypothetical protein